VVGRLFSVQHRSTVAHHVYVLSGGTGEHNRATNYELSALRLASRHRMQRAAICVAVSLGRVAMDGGPHGLIRYGHR